MVFAPIHYIPSAISALLIIFLAGRVRPHKILALIMASFAVLGLVGYLSQGELRFYPLDQHVLHSWLGTIALLLSLTVFLDGMLIHKLRGKAHCRLGYIAAFFAVLALLSGLSIFFGLQLLPPRESFVRGDLRSRHLCRPGRHKRMHPISCRRWRPRSIRAKS